MPRSHTIAGFLDELEARLRPSLDDVYLQQVLSEAEGHLRESFQEMVDLGVSQAEAESAAVAAFGRPRFEPKPSRSSRWVVPIAGAYGVVAVAVALNHLDGFGGGMVEPAKLAATLGVPLLAFFGLGGLGARPGSRGFGSLAVLGGLALLVLLPSHYVVRSPGWDLQRLLPAVESRYFAEVRISELGDPASKWSVDAAEQRAREFDRAFAAFQAGERVTVGPKLFWSPVEAPLEGMDPSVASAVWKVRGSEVADLVHGYRASTVEEAAQLRAGLGSSYADRLRALSPWSLVLPLVWGLAAVGAQTVGFGFYLVATIRRRRRGVA